MKKAFSIAESLISLLILSVCIALSTPLFTMQKKHVDPLTPEKAIMLCNSNDPSGCISGYTNNWNQSCSQVLAVWLNAPTGTYNLTPNGSSSPIATSCNMTNIASAAISGCNAGNTYDCVYAYTNNDNRGCAQIAASWLTAQSGTYNLTPSGSSSPVATSCNFSSISIAAISGCNSGNSTDCAYAYTNNINRGCYQVLSAWPSSITGSYKLTDSGSVISTSCNMSSLASAAITGCNTGNKTDCAYGYLNGINQSCAEIYSSWPAATSGTYNLSVNSSGNYSQTTCN